MLSLRRAVLHSRPPLLHPLIISSTIRPSNHGRLSPTLNNTCCSAVRYNAMSTSAAAMPTNSTGHIEQHITSTLTSTYTPHHLQVINESYMHSVPKNSETHFKVIVVSDKFTDMSIIQRHRSVNTALSDLLGPGKVHALSITAKTVAQWEKSSKVDASPNCLGGSQGDTRMTAAT